jgi:chloramphenicol 3-O phosphotransferase
MIIYLNGPSSSGKSTLAKALQEAFSEPFLHVGIDKIIGWMPEKINAWAGGEAPLGYSWKEGADVSGVLIQELQEGPFALKIGKTFQAVVLTLAKMGHNIVIDDVSFSPGQVDAWKELLKDFPVLWVGVNAPLSVLEEREKGRGNRIIGSARGQFHTVHKGAVYDLEIDTHRLSFSEMIEQIRSRLVVHSNYKQRISRTGVYGVAEKDGKILLVTQAKGPYAGRFDLPGGGIEFGEDVEVALHREMREETGMDFELACFLGNFSTCFEHVGKDPFSSYTFHQIGLIYTVSHLRTIGSGEGLLRYDWIDPKTLREKQVSPFVWRVLQQI